MNRVRFNRAITCLGSSSLIRTSFSPKFKMILWAFLSILVTLIIPHTTHAVAAQSSVSLNISSHLLTINIIPSPNGTFGSSSEATILVSTDNYSGYTLSIQSNNTTNLVNANNDTIPTINAPITEQTFRNEITYKNKWGYKPSQYITTNNDINTVVQNANYLPAPSTSGQILDITNIANSTNNSYTVSFGAKVGYGQPAGTYDYAYIISAVGNADAFNINYQANTEDTVNNMPSPNPQVLQIQAGTPVVESVTTLSNTTPTRTGYTFAGWCDVATTFNTTTKNQECSGTTYAAGANYGLDQTADGTNILLYAIWNINSYTFEFDEQGGSTVSDITRKYGETIGEGNIPVSVKNDLKLEGWYPNTNYNEAEKLTEDTQVTSNETYYAHWVTTLFPIVWNQMDACTFNGATNGNITGAGCEDYWDTKFIDTGKSLYSQTNFNKDYEIHFTIVDYNPSDQVDYYGTEDNSQQTFVNEKLSSTAGDKKAPGIVVRRSGNDNIEINSKYGDNQVHPPYNYAQVNDISVFRLDGTIYYSINGSPLTFLQNLPSSYSQFFGLTTWFGAYPRDDCTGDQYACTNAKRILQGTLSNMYIRLGEYSDDDIHTINFKKNNGTTDNEATYLIKDGNSINALPTDPSYANHIFQGWFTAQTGGAQITASTIPASSIDYYAHWLGTVAVANVTTAQITLQPDNSETIVIANSNELEPYTFSSDRIGVATVDPDTGEVTAVAPGSATITITGTTSGETKTIPVTVSGQLYQVYFDSQGGSAVNPNPVEVGNGGTINPLPTSIKTNSELEGWYTAPNGNGTKLTTATVFTSSTPTQYYANWIEEQYVCKPATTLHVETCTRSDSYGCKSAGYTNSGDSSTITYGSLIQSGATSLIPGNAMTCDINADGLYDETDERFYYITTIDNGTTNGNAALLYYKNIDNNENLWNDALLLLPTSSTTGWTNPHLVTFGAGDYNGKVARYMSYNEARTTCNNSTSGFGSNGKCLYILEKANFAQNNIRDGYWLGSTNSARVHTSSRNITTGSTRNGVRPMIEVPMDYVSLHVQESFTITFDAHNETNPTSVTVDEGDPLGTKIPANPTYTNHLFQGWFTTATGGSQIDANTTPTSSTTYHAQWLKTVTLAELARDTITVEPNGTTSIVVINSSELEPYTFSSGNNQIATVNSTTGEITGITNGTTTITMTGSTSGATKTITVNVATLLPVTQAIIGNTDLTTTVGGQTTVIITNSAELEPYTFSSDDISIATVNAAGVITGIGAGTTDIIITGTNSGLTKTLEVDILPAPATRYNVTFNPNGGSFSNASDASKEVEENTAVGALPTPTKANHMFFGWYTDDGTFYEEVYPEEVINNDVTYYAKWIENTSSFPIVWAETNACTFNGTSNLTGDYCLEDVVSGNPIDKTKYYIDTAIQLFTQANYQKDFEIGLNIVSYDSSSSENQATFVTSKAENLSGWPGFTLRKSGSSTNVEFTERFSMNNQAVSAPLVASANLNQVKIARIGEKIYYSWNGAAYTLLQDISANTTRFDTKVWFGATLNENGTGPRRSINAVFTDMYIKLGVPTDYVIELDVNDGRMNEPSSFTVTIGDRLGTLPTPTPPNSNYAFVGWFDESVTPAVQVTSETIPQGNMTYVAHYSYTSSNIPVPFNIANDALQGYQDLIDSWTQSPINIATFNKDANVINNSTWGDTSELNEQEFWQEIKDNFEMNNCSIPSYGDATKPLSTLTEWARGSKDCSKPNAYDTKIGAALNVYLNDINGEQVTYAKAENGIIHNMIPGQTYYWERADDSSVRGYVTATSVKGRRFIDIGSVRNVRDLGGLPATYTDGNNQTVTGTLAYGRLIRGERTWSTSANEFYNLGINKQYDVGDPSEYANDTKLSDRTWDPVVHYNFNYNAGDENDPNSNYMKTWKAVTDIMTDITNTNDPKNIYFHCRVGADRTGTTAYLLEGLLGVPDEARYEEYELTNLSGLYDRTRYYKKKTSNNTTSKFVFMMDYVLTNADIYNWYMHNSNADPNLIQAFRDAMIISN